MATEQIAPAGDDSQHLSREIWKPVPSEPGVLASSWGRVLLAPSYAPLPSGGFRLYRPEPRLGSVAKASKAAKHVYRNIMVKRAETDRRQAPRKVHQLVCEAFHGPKPFEGAVVIHKDEDGLNNVPENLKWGTQKENLNAPGFKASKLKAPLFKNCAFCGHVFRRSDKAQKFCSSKCYGASNRKASEVPEWRI